MMLPFSDLIESGRFDRELCALADRHYSRQTPGAPQFCPPGELIMLRDSRAEFVFAWLNQKYRMDEQRGYYCSIFRNESPRLSSEIILEAERFAVARWGSGRAFTKVDPRKIRSVNPGFCFKKAGWRFCGLDPEGKHILEKALV